MEPGTLAGMKIKGPFRVALVGAALAGVLNPSGMAQQSPAQTVQAGSGDTQTAHLQKFRITPVHPIAELRAEALKATPPKEEGVEVSTALVDVAKLNPTIHLDIRYATTNNFLGEPVYEQARAFLQRPAAMALEVVSEKLRKKSYGLLIYDAYRPWYVTKIFWEATPPELREFVADPAKGSVHNRGCAVDLSLYDLKTGEPVTMPSDFDEMSPRSYANYAGATKEEKRNREILRKAMESEGFVQRPNEWWHYDYKDWKSYGILNMGFPPPERTGDSISLLANVYRVGKGVSAPKILHREPPQFSPEARDAHQGGTAIVSVIIGEDGSVRNVQVVHGAGHGLDAKVAEAVRKWKFQPAMKDGQPVAVMVNVEVSFHLF